MSHLRLLSALLCLGVIPTFGADLELIQSTAARHGISLNGSWRAIVDPYESGYYDYRYKPQADGGFGANKKPQSNSDLVEYDFDTADRLQVPGDWNTQRPDLMLYEGTVWYKRDFDCAVEARAPHLSLVRRRQLSRHGLPERRQGRRARRRLHALPVRNHR